MPKVPLSTITSGYGTVDALNQNFDAIEAAFDNTLSRDGDTPNEMQANLDMNGNALLNVGTINGAPITALGDISGYVNTALAAATSASASATSAADTYDLFDDRYLGSKTSNPTVDNDGNALQVGAEYWNSVSNERRTWTGSAWVSSITVVPDGSVTTAKLADGAASGAKLGSKIQSISASVSANALTVSASYLSLDFRSTTLSSGEITTVTGTPANLVIPSGATLGTVSGVQSDLVVLAINNAGTIALAVVNLAGGVRLDETNVISANAINSGSNNSNVIYSTTLLPASAYRVIGLLRSTQATAGSWTTAPSLVQGMGGNALVAMQSLGYGQTWQNVTASRSLATTYYNTTNKAIMLSILPSVSNGEDVSIQVNGVNVASVNPFAGFTGELTSQLTAIVPPGQTYRVNFTGAVVLNSWLELR